MPHLWLDGLTPNSWQWQMAGLDVYVCVCVCVRNGNGIVVTHEPASWERIIMIHYAAWRIVCVRNSRWETAFRGVSDTRIRHDTTPYLSILLDSGGKGRQAKFQWYPSNLRSKLSDRNLLQAACHEFQKVQSAQNQTFKFGVAQMFQRLSLVFEQTGCNLKALNNAPNGLAGWGIRNLAESTLSSSCRIDLRNQRGSICALIYIVWTWQLGRSTPITVAWSPRPTLRRPWLPRPRFFVHEHSLNSQIFLFWSLFQGEQFSLPCMVWYSMIHIVCSIPYN